VGERSSSLTSATVSRVRTVRSVFSTDKSHPSLLDAAVASGGNVRMGVTQRPSLICCAQEEGTIRYFRSPKFTWTEWMP
jgi:hypothetical protein